MDMRREDGRQPDDLRVLACTCGVLSQSDGSCRFQMNETVVIASVFGPLPERAASKELVQEARVQVNAYQSSSAEYSALQQQQQLHGGAGDLQGLQRASDMERVVAGVLESVILTRLHPRKLIRVSIQVVNDGGSATACAVLACSGALLDAGIAMKGVPSAASCAVLDGENFTVLVDPSKAEESPVAARALVLVCTLDDERSDKVLAAVSQGRLRREQLALCVEKCSRAAAAARSFLRLSFASLANDALALDKPERVSKP